jgi:nucleoside 2-deoxyribosyltransferase
MMTIYLSGPINGRTDVDYVDWWDEAKHLLAPLTTLVPMDRDYRLRELEPGLAREIVENDKADILQCAAMLVMFDKPGVGSSMEVLFAYERGILVHVVDVSGKPLSPWLLYHATAVHASLEAACEAIKGALS